MPIGNITDVLPDPVLTGHALELATGGPYAADRIAPPATVVSDSFKYGTFKREDIKDEVKSRQAPGQPASEVNFGITYTTGTVEYHKLKSRIPDALRANAPQASLDTRRTTMLTGKLLLGVERRVKTLCHAAIKTKDAPSIKWDGANPDIRGDILAGKTTFRRNAGMNPNVIVVPPIVWDVIARDSAVLDLLKRHRDMLASEVVEQILQMIVVVPGAIIEQSNPGAAADIADVWDDDEVYYLWVDPTAGDDLGALTALRQVRSAATGGQGLYIKKYRDPDESAEADWVSAHLNQTEIVTAQELILRQLDVFT